MLAGGGLLRPTQPELALALLALGDVFARAVLLAVRAVFVAARSSSMAFTLAPSEIVAVCPCRSSSLSILL